MATDRKNLIMETLRERVKEMMKKRVKNSQLEVVFEYKENKFFLRTYGAIDNIPDNWEDEQLIMGYGGWE